MKNSRLVLGLGLVLIVAIYGGRSVDAKEVGADRELSELVLVKSIDGKAVVRFGAGPMEVVSVGDRLGTNKAEVKEIGAGRLVLEEVFTGKDGRPNRAEVILKDGEKGGERFLARPEEEPMPSTRSLMIVPKGQGKGR
ncbi:MAG TPA: hypothetical protein VFG95_05195 [Nitrospiria bacterium]|nr:hypothetical protein [Nitrospiria bacterium]